MVVSVSNFEEFNMLVSLNGPGQTFFVGGEQESHYTAAAAPPVASVSLPHMASPKGSVRFERRQVDTSHD